MQRHRYSPSMPHQVMPSQYLYLHDTHTRTHAQTNSANKSNSAVHRRLTTKTGKEVVHWGAARCILTRAACTYSLPRIDLILTTTSEKSKDTVCNRANSIQLFSSWWCFSNQRSPLIIVADVFCLFCFFLCTTTVCNISTTRQWKFSHVSQLKYHQTSPYLPQTLQLC